MKGKPHRKPMKATGAGKAYSAPKVKAPKKGGKKGRGY